MSVFAFAPALVSWVRVGVTVKFIVVVLEEVCDMAVPVTDHGSEEG